MCLLTFFPDGTLPDTEALLNGATFNDDGHGYAIVDRASRRIIVDRGMDAKEMVYSFAAQRAKYPEGPAMFHSRLATDGLINLLNVHPFPIGGDSRTVLAHNGVMPLRPSKGDVRSDTRAVAEDYIPRAYGSLRRRRARLAFERWLTRYNKVVILTVDPRFRDNAFILNENMGIWDKGVWYSNDAYLGWYPSNRAYTYEWDASTGGLMPARKILSTRPDTDRYVSDDTMFQCWQCKGMSSVENDDCPFCGLCFDCGEVPNVCQCYRLGTVSAQLDQGN